MKKKKRGFLTAMLCMASGFLFSTPAYAATLNDVPASSYKVGNDAYVSSSPGLTTRNLITSKGTSSDTNIYYKTPGLFWVNIGELRSASDLLDQNTGARVSQQVLDSWRQPGKFYINGQIEPTDLQPAPGGQGGAFYVYSID